MRGYSVEVQHEEKIKLERELERQVIRAGIDSTSVSPLDFYSSDFNFVELIG